MKNKKQKQAWLVFLFLAVVAGGLFGMHGTAHAGLWTVAADGLELVFKALLYAIFVVFGWLLSVAVTIFGWAVDPQYVSGPTGFLNRQSIYDLWKFIRDFFNIFFIIVLLYTAFTIVFQVAKDYKKTLLHLVIMALLVNFSFPISRFLIDVANVPMYFFLNQTFTGSNSKEAFGTVLGASKIESILLTGQESGKAGFSAAKTLELPHLISAVIFMFLFSISLLVLAVMFVIRLVALVILVIFSSVGFAASILPGFNKYASQWWDMFLKYAFFGPAAALMLLITVRFLAEVGHDTTFRNVQNVAMGAAAVGNQNFIASMAFFSIPIILLWFTIGMAQSFSIAGAGAVVGWGRGIAKRAGKIGWGMTGGAAIGSAIGLSKYGGRKLESKLASTKYGQYLSPTVWKEAWKARSEEQKHEDMVPIKLAKARVHNQLNKTMGKLPLAHADKTNYELLEQQGQMKKYDDEILQLGGGELNEDRIRDYLTQAKEEGNTLKTLSAMKAFSKINGLDNITHDHGIEFNVPLENVPGKGKGRNIQKYAFPVAEQMLVQQGVPLDLAREHLNNYSEIAGTKGDFAFWKYYIRDAKGKLIPNPNQKNDVAASFRKIKAQTRQDIIHPRSFFDQYVDENGEDRFYGDISEIGAGIAGEINSNDSNSASRKRADTDKVFIEGWEDISKGNRATYTKFISEFNKNPGFREYVIKTTNANLPQGAPSMPTDHL